MVFPETCYRKPKPRWRMQSKNDYLCDGAQRIFQQINEAHVRARRARTRMDVQMRRKILLDGMGKLDALGIEDDALTNRLNDLPLPERPAPAPAAAKLGKDAVLNLPKGTTVKVTDRPPSGAPSDADADPSPSSPAKEQKPPWMKAEKLGTLDDLVNEEPPPPASVAVVTGSATALERVFLSAEFPPLR